MMPNEIRKSSVQGTAAEIEMAFRNTVKAKKCPHCEMEFTDFSIEWGDAWQEGRDDLMKESGLQERDGPCKLKCELCGGKSWFNYFNGIVTPA